MKCVLWLLGGWSMLGCSAVDPATSGPSQTPEAGGASVSGGGAGGASSATGGASAGMLSVGGGSSSSGDSGTGGSVNGGSGAGMPVGGAGGNAGSGAGGGNGCTPDAAGSLAIAGETVHDARTCLDWMKATKTGVSYAAAEMYCADARLGGFDDWRIPNASEYASIVTLCGKYPPEGPVDTKFFDQQGDGYWTTTPAGELNKVCAVGMLNAGGYYHYGTAGPQVVRCVRGAGSVEVVADCTTAQGCMNW